MACSQDQVWILIVMASNTVVIEKNDTEGDVNRLTVKYPYAIVFAAFSHQEKTFSMPVGKSNYIGVRR